MPNQYSGGVPRKVYVEIYRRWKAGEVRARLAKEYGVNKGYIYDKMRQLECIERRGMGLEAWVHNVENQRLKRLKEKPMPLKEALKRLIDIAAMKIEGTGVGMPRQLSEGEKDKGVEAIERVWKYLYGQEMDSSEKYNMGL